MVVFLTRVSCIFHQLACTLSIVANEKGGILLARTKLRLEGYNRWAGRNPHTDGKKVGLWPYTADSQGGQSHEQTIGSRSTSPCSQSQSWTRHHCSVNTLPAPNDYITPSINDEQTRSIWCSNKVSTDIQHNCSKQNAFYLWHIFSVPMALVEDEANKVYKNASTPGTRRGIICLCSWQ